jgi:integrase
MTSAKSYRLLRAILATAVADGLIQTNPCRVRGAGTERSAERPIVGAELVLKLAEEIGPRFRALVLLAGFGGLRLGELLGLRRRHIDLDAATVTVEEQIVSLEGGQRLVTEPKTDAGRRTVALPQLVVDALSDHLDCRGDQDPDALLFPAEDGTPLPATTLYKHWRRARHRAERDDLHLHDLRHVAGTLAAWTGATERELMARLGHANPAAARRYQHAARDRDRAIAAGLDTILQSLQDSAAR